MIDYGTYGQALSSAAAFAQADRVVILSTLAAQALKEVGIPSPGVTQTALVYAGYQMAHGDIGLGLAIVVAAFAGSLCGCTSAYAAGRYLGHGLLSHWGKSGFLSVERLEQAKDRLGTKAFLPVLVGRFFPALMAPLSVTAGTMRMPAGKFAAGIGVSMLLWAAFFLSLGIFFGQAAGDFLVSFNPAPVLAIMFAGVLAAGTGWFLWHRLSTWKRNQAGNTDKHPEQDAVHDLPPVL
jgi:membrane protein DedA with SNARE-associated domain